MMGKDVGEAWRGFCQAENWQNLLLIIVLLLSGVLPYSKRVEQVQLQEMLSNFRTKSLYFPGIEKIQGNGGEKS